MQKNIIKIITGASYVQYIIIYKYIIIINCLVLLPTNRKAAVTVTSVDTQVLADVCESMRKYTRKRMHFIKYIVMYKTDISSKRCQIAFVIVTHGNETAMKNEWLKDSFSQARFSKESGQQMTCEGEISHMTVTGNPPQTVSVAFFSKQKSFRTLTCDLPSNQLVRFSITNQEGTIAGEGEMCA